MREFGFQLGTRVEFGLGRVDTVGGEARRFAQSRALLVTDPGLIAAGLVEPVERSLAGAGLECRVFAGISANPRDEECQAAAGAAVGWGAELVVGLGGGSAIDTAKAAAALATNGGTVRDIEDPRCPENDPLPIIAVPTTAGTGSEVTWVAVITDEDEHRKMTLLDRRIAPRVAILDPRLTVSLPRSLTASTGMDALIHAIEAYTCRAANPISDALALSAMQRVAGALAVATEDGTDLQARSDLLVGSLEAGMAFGNADVGAVHCLGESLGAFFDTPHGLACAVFLPFVLDFNASADPARHGELAAALGVAVRGGDALTAAGDGARALAAKVGIPSLHDLQRLTPGDMQAIARMSSEHVCSPSNARDIDYEDYLALVHRAYDA